MTDILARLSKASWRGIVFPCAGREYGFRQEFARHRYIYQDNELIDSIGKENPAYTFQIPAREDLARGPYKNWFTVFYPKFLKACEDKSEGDLFDPVHGRRQCKCASLREVLGVTKRDGVDVTVEFVYSPSEQVAVPTPSLAIETIEGAKDMAAFLDSEEKKIPWKQEPPPGSSLDLFDFGRSITDQLELNKSRFSANMSRLSSRMENLSASIDRLKDPNSQAARRNARRLFAAAIKLKQSATAPIVPTKFIVLARDIGVMSLAALYNMTLDDLRKLNPTLGRTTTVKHGTYVRVNRAT